MRETVSQRLVALGLGTSQHRRVTEGPAQLRDQAGSARCKPVQGPKP